MIPRPEINFQRTPVTLIIAAISAALALVCSFDADRQLEYYNNWLGILPIIWAGEVWRPFTTTLMHGDLLHAFFNLYWLIVFGPALENRFGSYRYLGLVVLLGYVSMMPEYVIGSYNLTRPIMIVGLSGIVYGLFGMLFIGRRWHPELEAVCNKSTSTLLLGWFVFCIIATRAGVMNVANIAHGAGFGFGVLYGLVAFDKRHRWQWAIPAVAASLVVLATLVACPGHNGYEFIKQQGRLWIFQPRQRIEWFQGNATASFHPGLAADGTSAQTPPFGAGLLTPPKRPTGGLPQEDRRRRPSVPVWAGSGDPRPT